ncbi:MAG: hypothetical protein R3D44_14155 [Hyphomicrobiaceae bacterium]
MKLGKGTEDFEFYVRNLRQAVETYSVGAQLKGNVVDTRPMRTLVRNPYAATIADMGVCRFRAAGTVGGSGR